LKICFVGAGAVGGFYGALLARQGHDVSFIARGAHLAAIQKNGLRVVGPLGDFIVKTPAASDSTRIGPVDVVVHSVTKFLGGHNDLIGGAVIVSDPALAEKMKFAQKAVGAVLSPWDAWLLLRGIKTLHLRVARAQESAVALAKFLSSHPFVRKVFYPGLPGHPGAELHASQADGPGSIVSFELARERAVPRFLSSLKTVLLAESVGGVESLITHPATMTHADIPPEEQAAVGLTPSLVRLSVGVEHVDDLMEDLSRALRKAKG